MSLALLAIAMALPASPAADLAQHFPDIPRTPLLRALEARARLNVDSRSRRGRILTLIDYSRTSTEHRLWVLDLSRKKVLHRELVAHGRGSGANFARRFSNTPGSHATSLGLFETAGTYSGRHGYSLKLRGLDRGLNDNAERRAIVIHGAWYVSPEFAHKHGRLGRSHGCPALDRRVSRRVIDAIKGGTLLFAYGATQPG